MAAERRRYNRRTISTKIVESKMNPEPKIGQEIYVHSSYYIDHGEDDICGGLATISKKEMGKSAGEETWFVGFREIPARMYNYKILLEEQETLAKELGSQRAHPCPDLG